MRLGSSLHHVRSFLVAAHGLSSCSTWVACEILVPCSGIKPASHALEVWCLNHWTTREILNSFESTSIPTLSSFLLGDFYFLN